MKEFDFTTESEQDISLDDILGEFRASAKEPDADALYSYLVSDADLPADDTLPELESENYQSSDFSYSDSFTSGVDTELYVPDELELIDDEDDDVSVYVPGKKHVSAPVAPEVEETADFADEEVSELPDKKKSARSSASDEARRYIAGIQGVFGRSRRKKERRSLKELQEELDAKEYDFTVGGGMLTIHMNGKKEMLGIEIKPEVVDPDDIEMLQDLIVAGVNEAVSSIEKTNAEEMSKVTGNISIPGMF